MSDGGVSSLEAGKCVIGMQPAVFRKGMEWKSLLGWKVVKGFWKVYGGSRKKENNLTLAWLEEQMVWLPRHTHHMENKGADYRYQG